MYRPIQLSQPWMNVLREDRNMELPGAAPQAFSVTTASGIAVRDNRQRKLLILCNDGTEAIYLCRGQTASINAGIRLPVNGVLIDAPDSQGRIYTGPWSAIIVTSTTVLTISEE